MVNNLMHFVSQSSVPNGAAERRRRLLKLRQIWNVTEPPARVAPRLRYRNRARRDHIGD
jgi:hypothetical protein